MKVYVKVKKDKNNENFFKFDCTGYGWVEKECLEDEYISVQCEDKYNGARGWTCAKDEIDICDIQKECPYTI